MTDLPNSTPDDLAKGKICLECGEWRPFSGYGKELRGKYGLRSRCKICRIKEASDRTEAARQRRLAIPKPDGFLSRQKARDLGQGWYFTGKKCRRGHLSRRSVSNSGCHGCVMQAYHSKPKENPKKFLTRRDDGTYFGVACPKCGCTERNKDKKCAPCRAQYEIDRTPQNRKLREKWKKQDPEKWYAAKREQGMRQRAKRLKRCPAWVSNRYKDELLKIYGACPDGMHCDHIVPLIGKLVSGLHVPWNLQYLDSYENHRKSNKFPYCDEQLRLARTNLE